MTETPTHERTNARTHQCANAVTHRRTSAWRIFLLITGICLLALAAFMPVEKLVHHAISPAVRQQILSRGTPERITFLENQFAASLQWFRGASLLLGSWLVLLGGLFSRLMKWDAEAAWICVYTNLPTHERTNAPTHSPLSPPAYHRTNTRTHLLPPLLWAALTVILSLPIITKGFEHEELLEMDMLAKRGILVTAACQNQPPRAAQPAYTMLESLAVRAFGDSEAVARAPSVVLGALVMIPLFIIAFNLGGLRLANLACGLTATNGLFLFYINYARGYAFATTMYVSAICMGMLILQKSTWRRWLLMGLFILIGVYCHMATGVYIAVVCLVMLTGLLIKGLRGYKMPQNGTHPQIHQPTNASATLRSYGQGAPTHSSATSHVSRLTFHLLRSLLVRPVMVWGTVSLTLAWLYSIGVPASLDYLKAFDLTSYYMAYHINFRFLKVMLTLLAGLRMVPGWNWFVLAGGLTGIVILWRRNRAVTAMLAGPLLVGIVVFYAKHLFVYPRYFIFLVPFLCLFFAASIDAVVSKLSGIVSHAPSSSDAGLPVSQPTNTPKYQSTNTPIHQRIAKLWTGRAGAPTYQRTLSYLPDITVWLLIIAVSVINLQRLYAMERCGVRTAVEDARAAMQPGDRVAGILDGKVTVEHYFPGTVSMFSADDFWRILNSTNPPEWVINVPYIDYDIPGGKKALEKKYNLYRAYPSWMDVDDDQDSVYLYHLK